MRIDEFFRGLSALFASGDHDGVSAYLRRHLAQARMRGDGPAAVTVLNEMIGYYRSVSRHKEALEASEQAIAEMIRAGAEDSADFGTTLLNAATAYRAAGDGERALALYERAMAAYRRHLAPDDARLAGLYNNISALHMESGAYEAAVGLLRQSALIMDGKGDALDAATVYSNLALALSRSGREAEAEEALARAMALFAPHGGQNPRPPHYAAALCALADVRYRMGRPADAARLFEQALDHIMTCYGENADFAVTAANCAMAYEAAGDGGKAERFRAAALAATRRIERDNAPQPDRSAP